MSRSKNQTNDGRLPYSGEIIGAVVKALDLDHGILKERTAQRFLRGQHISERKREEIFKALGEAVVDLGIVPKPAMLERFGTPMSSIIGEAFAATGKRWDALLALTESRSAPIRDDAVVVNGFLRLAVVDFALRIFALARLADLDPPASVTPIWAEDNSRSKLLRDLAKDAGLTREQLAGHLEKSDTSIDNWLDGKIRPTRKNVSALTRALADGNPNVDAEQIEHEVQRQFALAYLTDLLAPVIGRKQVLELSTALYRFVRVIWENVAELERPPLEENPTAEVVALAYGTAHASIFPLLEDLASVEADRVWKNYIMAAAVSWDVAVQQIAIEAGSPRTAAGLAQDISDVSETASNRSKDVENGPTYKRNAEISKRLTQESSIETIPRIIHGDIRAMSREWQEDVKLRRALVLDFPTDPEAHFNLGSYLGMLGKWTRRRDLIDEGINECKIAWALLPEWDAPAVEPAIILANFGAYDESLQELNWAKSVLPAPTPHLHYGFGYTLMMLERYDQALQHLEEVLKSKADYALALRDAARCSFKLGDHVSGRRYAKRARQFGDPVEYDLWQKGKYSKRKTRRKVD